MIKRTIYFSNPAYLSLNRSQLLVRLPEVEKQESLPKEFKKTAHATIPVEDIGFIILDHRQITITQGLMEALLNNNVAIVTCDGSHHPVGLMLPLCGNSIQNERYRAQLDASEPLKKQLWAQTISQKIKNQYTVLKNLHISAKPLIPLYKTVKSGDTDNCEATAAAYYWQSIFAHVPDFRRHRAGISPNNYLNYGYAILRAVMARSIVAAGMLPTLGIHHMNRYNAYCLADDLMEPYRPIVDDMVYGILQEHGPKEDIPIAIKSILLKIPAVDVIIDNEHSPLLNATQRTAVSLVKAFTTKKCKLLFPELK
jgi:CRISP-associated protein Cas1